jgi:peptidoglycan hydrolase-like protein with peptidoglycan-binding domain
VALRSKGYYHGRIDAIRGPLTRAALIAFQRHAGLVPDAIDGPRTRAALGRLGRPLYGSRYLRKGAVGWDVAVLQFLLRRRGFSTGVPDGRFGRRTRSALVRFQRSRGLRPDGVLGPRTARVLCSAAPCTFRARPRLRRFARYLVRPGDTLTAIAARYRVSLRAIMRVNPRQSADLLLAGSVLRIPLGPLVRAARSEGRRSVRESIDYWAGFYGVDRHLVRAVAWMESGDQQHVVSPTGAEGVMQVAPETWSYVETVLLGRTVPHTMQGNVRVGVAMLRHLLHEHGMNRSSALAAYAQGDQSLRVQGMLPVTRMYVADVLALARRL